MKDLAPHITRQRLVVEGFFEREVKRETIVEFFDHITKELELRTYGEPSIHMTSGEGKEINQGFDAFIPLIDSGISLYVWGNAKFFSTVIYTCKRFDTKKAVGVVKEFFKAKEVAHQSF
jgi:S-adenosylmethionine decarboxylase